MRYSDDLMCLKSCFGTFWLQPSTAQLMVVCYYIHQVTHRHTHTMEWNWRILCFHFCMSVCMVKTRWDS